jgi:hypothetical protein
VSNSVCCLTLQWKALSATGESTRALSTDLCGLLNRTASLFSDSSLLVCYSWWMSTQLPWAHCRPTAHRKHQPALEIQSQFLVTSTGSTKNWVRFLILLAISSNLDFWSGVCGVN